MTASEPAIAIEAESAQRPQTLRQKLAAGRFVISVEIDPPRGLAVKRVLRAAAQMHAAGADCVNVGDSPMAEVRLSAVAMASLLRENVGIETVLHCSTRDRNLMALQADLLGAHALGVRNVLCIKGDDHVLGSYAAAQAVWHLNALDLMRLLKGFNGGADAAGKAIKPAPRFFIGAAVNPGAVKLDDEVALVRRKVRAGAEFLLSQAVFEADCVERLVEKLGPDHPPIILGIWPPHSLKQAEFLDAHINRLPPGMVDAVGRAGDDGERCGIELAQELIERVRPLVQGVYIIPSFGRFSGTAEIVATARELAGDAV
jgi:homocysteine S-methyltransferase